MPYVYLNKHFLSMFQLDYLSNFPMKYYITVFVLLIHILLFKVSIFNYYFQLNINLLKDIHLQFSFLILKLELITQKIQSVN